jgi:shikimate dehydrogenase
MTDRYAVVGNPVAHSRSPEIHAAFARECGAEIQYDLLLAPLTEFARTIDAFRLSGASGANVTVPFKREAFDYAGECTARAKRGGSVNTLSFRDNKIIGDSTDGIGLCRDIIQNIGYPLRGAKILLIGAGGAARSAVGALLDCDPITLTITNRTLANAKAIAQELGVGDVVTVAAPEELSRFSFDVVIDATSSGLTGSQPLVPASCFGKNTLAYDMMYGKGLTPFLRLAAGAGATTADGIGMLVEQAAEAFYVWRGVQPQTGQIIKRLRQALS